MNANLLKSLVEREKYEKVNAAFQWPKEIVKRVKYKHVEIEMVVRIDNAIQN